MKNGTVLAVGTSAVGSTESRVVVNGAAGPQLVELNASGVPTGASTSLPLTSFPDWQSISAAGINTPPPGLNATIVGSGLTPDNAVGGIAWTVPVSGGLSGGSGSTLPVLSGTYSGAADFPLAAADAAFLPLTVGSVWLTTQGTGGCRTGFWANPFSSPYPENQYLNPPGSMTGGGPYYWEGETSGVNLSGTGVGYWRGIDEVYSAEGVLHEYSADVHHAVRWDLNIQQAYPMSWMPGPASLEGAYWWDGSMYRTRLMSRARKINNAGIIVGKVWDYLGVGDFPKAAVWLPGGPCYLLDEFCTPAAGNWISDALDISDDNIVVAVMHTPSGDIAIALRLPIIP